MKWIRLMLVVILSVVIPINGFAAPVVDVCPMQALDTLPPMVEMMAADESDVVSTAMPDCCVEMDSESPNDSPCKPGQACSVGWLYFALPTSFTVASPLASRIGLAHYLAPSISSSSATIWHPPRLF